MLCLGEPSLGAFSESLGREPILFEEAQLRTCRVGSFEYDLCSGSGASGRLTVFEREALAGGGLERLREA